MADYTNFTSLPPDQEAAFVVFERRTAETMSKAAMIGLLAGAAVFVLGLGIYFGVSPQENQAHRDMNINQLQKKSTKTEAPNAP